jgi:glutamate formiminotransferase
MYFPYRQPKCAQYQILGFPLCHRGGTPALRYSDVFGMDAIIECVPNFSEGRDENKVRAIQDAISWAGAHVLRAERDVDHNRSVITAAGAPEILAQAIFAGIAKALEVIDLNHHVGVHPRLGAADVIPFVPLGSSTLADCVGVAHRLGKKVWAILGIPVYFYEAAALRPVCFRLENVRRGQFEAQFEAPQIPPDLGGPGLHPTAGAVIIGARKLLVAFNINLDSSDLNAARRIAKKIRASNGGLPRVKALGVALVSRKLAQVSMNLTDFEVTSPQAAFDVVEAEAAKEGISILSTQLVGLIPEKAVTPNGRAFQIMEDFGPHRILERCLDTMLRVPYK